MNDNSFAFIPICKRAKSDRREPFESIVITLETNSPRLNCWGRCLYVLCFGTKRDISSGKGSSAEIISRRSSKCMGCCVGEQPTAGPD